MIADIISPQAKRFAPGAQTVLRGHENRSRHVVLLKGNLVQNNRSESRGISARVTKNGRYGFSSVASYTEKDAETVLKAATENALFLDQRGASPRRTYPALPGGKVPGCRLIDGRTLLPDRKRFFSSDRLTLSDAGMEAVAEKLHREIMGTYRL